MIVIPLPDPLNHHALALAKIVAATSWLPSANVVRAADENLSQVGVVVPTPKSAALAPQEICNDLIQSGISDVNPMAKWRIHPNSHAHLWRTNRCSIIWKHRSNRRSESRQISRQNGGIQSPKRRHLEIPTIIPTKCRDRQLQSAVTYVTGMYRVPRSLRTA